MPVEWTASSHGVDWRLELERQDLLPGRLVPGRLDVTSHGTVDARAVVVELRAEEHWKHEVSTTDAQGHTSTRVETERRELVRQPVQLDGAIHLAPGESRSWSFELPVPPLGPATLEAEVAGLDWTVAAKLDVPGGLDSAIEGEVRVLQPVGLLRAGAVSVGQFALFGAADVIAGGITGTVTLDPVPLCSGEPFTAVAVLRAEGGTKLQEVRAELRVRVEATVSGGLDETIVAWAGRPCPGSRCPTVARRRRFT
jgi:hypothetical protein